MCKFSAIFSTSIQLIESNENKNMFKWNYANVIQLQNDERIENEQKFNFNFNFKEWVGERYN